MTRMILPMSRRWSLAVLLTALALPACSDGNVLGPENQLQVVNEQGTFEWQATALDDVKQTLTYTWSNTGSTANVDQASSLGAGTATLTIRDGAGVQVYTRDLTENGTFQTTAGATGSWVVVVSLDGASGAVNFRLNTP